MNPSSTVWSKVAGDYDRVGVRSGTPGRHLTGFTKPRPAASPDWHVIRRRIRRPSGRVGGSGDVEPRTSVRWLALLGRSLAAQWPTLTPLSPCFSAYREEGAPRAAPAGNNGGQNTPNPVQGDPGGLGEPPGAPSSPPFGRGGLRSGPFHGKRRTRGKRGVGLPALALPTWQGQIPRATWHAEARSLRARRTLQARRAPLVAGAEGRLASPAQRTTRRRARCGAASCSVAPWSYSILQSSPGGTKAGPEQAQVFSFTAVALPSLTSPIHPLTVLRPRASHRFD
eukprot:scaffold2173_cov416-Prasinococcus_capsulatus_cf.AAC.6